MLLVIPRRLSPSRAQDANVESPQPTLQRALVYSQLLQRLISSQRRVQRLQRQPTHAIDLRGDAIEITQPVIDDVRDARVEAPPPRSRSTFPLLPRLPAPVSRRPRRRPRATRPGPPRARSRLPRRRPRAPRRRFPSRGPRAALPNVSFARSSTARAFSRLCSARDRIAPAPAPARLDASVVDECGRATRPRGSTRRDAFDAFARSANSNDSPSHLCSGFLKKKTLDRACVFVFAFALAFVFARPRVGRARRRRTRRGSTRNF